MVVWFAGAAEKFAVGVFVLVLTGLDIEADV